MSAAAAAGSGSSPSGALQTNLESAGAVGDDDAEPLPTSARLYLGGLGPEITDAAVRGRFASLAQIDALDVIRDEESGDCRGWAYVTLSPLPGVVPVPSVKDVIRKVTNTYHGRVWKGNRLRLEVANPTYRERLEGEWALAKEEAAEEATLRLQIWNKKCTAIPRSTHL